MKHSRRQFVSRTALASTALAIAPAVSFCKNSTKTASMSAPKISLAQWSLHRALQKGKTKALDFARVAKNDFGIGAVEYVNQFYIDHATDETFWKEMKQRADDHGVQSLLIMVDSEGDLGNPKDKMRQKAVENHHKWINAAALLGCHSIRINAFGQADREVLSAALIDGLGKLASYGAQNDIHVLIENHGLHTSDGKFIVQVIKEVDQPYLGTLPDFGNWCLNAEWGSIQNNQCSEVYDPYTGVKEFLPYAKGVSAKAYNFDAEGNETILNYKRLLQLVKDAEFQGYIGVEYEGSALSEAEGIKATKALIERVWKELD